MKIVVTGGAGFIGSHLCKKLLEQGNQVICVDNLYTGSKNNIKELMTNSNFTFIEHDITEPFREQANRIYNLACPASPVHYQKDPVYTIKTNILGMFNVLELARKTNAQVLQASTSEVYGDPEQHPQKETYWGNVNPIGIRSCYDEGKRAAETMCFDFHRQYGTKIRVARIFNTYGPNMAANDGRVVSNFIIQALKNQPITLYGDGKQTRSFCYVSDMVDGLIKVMNSEEIGPINLGNPGEFTMLELAEEILNQTGSKSKIEHKPLPQDDPKQRKPNIILAKQKLGWEPKVQLKEGIKKTIEYFKKII